MLSSGSTQDKTFQSLRDVLKNKLLIYLCIRLPIRATEDMFYENIDDLFSGMSNLFSIAADIFIATEINVFSDVSAFLSFINQFQSKV